MKKCILILGIVAIVSATFLIAQANSEFIMPVEDFDTGVYPLAENNTVAVMGCVTQGSAKVGDIVELVGVGTKKKIKRIETLGKYLDKATAGKCYGIILGDTDYNALRNLKSLKK
jgi:translation elongation factor EF-Tu-like GTPase